MPFDYGALHGLFGLGQDESVTISGDYVLPLGSEVMDLYGKILLAGGATIHVPVAVQATFGKPTSAPPAGGGVPHSYVVIGQSQTIIRAFTLGSPEAFVPPTVANQPVNIPWGFEMPVGSSFEAMDGLKRDGSGAIVYPGQPISGVQGKTIPLGPNGSVLWQGKYMMSRSIVLGPIAVVVPAPAPVPEPTPILEPVPTPITEPTPPPVVMTPVEPSPEITPIPTPIMMEPTVPAVPAVPERAIAARIHLILRDEAGNVLSPQGAAWSVHRDEMAMTAPYQSGLLGQDGIVSVQLIPPGWTDPLDRLGMKILMPGYDVKALTVQVPG